MTRIDKLNGSVLQRFAGLFLLVFGAIGILTELLPYSSTAAVRFSFAAASAGTFTGLCLTLYRWPSTFITAMWIGITVAFWQFKNGSSLF